MVSKWRNKKREVHIKLLHKFLHHQFCLNGLLLNYNQFQKRTRYNATNAFFKLYWLYWSMTKCWDRLENERVLHIRLTPAETSILFHLKTQYNQQCNPLFSFKWLYRCKLILPVISMNNGTTNYVRQYGNACSLSRAVW